MKVKFQIPNLQHEVVAINGTILANGVPAGDMPNYNAFSSFFHIGNDCNDRAELRAVKYGKQSLVLTLNDGTNNYECAAIRLFGPRRPHRPI